MKPILVLFTVFGLVACGASPKSNSPRAAASAQNKAVAVDPISPVVLREIILGRPDKTDSLAITFEKSPQFESFRLVNPIRFYSDSKERQLEFPVPSALCSEAKVRFQALIRNGEQWSSVGDRIYECKKGKVSADLNDLAQANVGMLRAETRNSQSKNEQFSIEFEVQNLGPKIESRPTYAVFSRPNDGIGIIEYFHLSGSLLQFYREELTNRTDAPVKVEIRITGGLRLVQRVGEVFWIGNRDESVVSKSIAHLKARRIQISSGSRSTELELDSEGRAQFVLPENSSFQVSWILEANNRCKLFKYGTAPKQTNISGLDWEANFTRDLFIEGEKVLSGGYSNVSRGFEVEATTPNVHSCQGWIHLSHH